jgi:hypothetical protein
MTTHTPHLTKEGNGFVITCSCTWIAYHVHRASVEDMHRKHLPKERK